MKVDLGCDGKLEACVTDNSSVGDLRPCSYADSVGRDVPANFASDA